MQMHVAAGPSDPCFAVHLYAELVLLRLYENDAM